jgi:hypothetical protein
MGDRYDAIFEPNSPTHIWRNGRAIATLNGQQIWRAERAGETVEFRAIN